MEVVVPNTRNSRLIEAANQIVYKAITVPMIYEEDANAPKGFGAHGDQELILEEAFCKFLQFNCEVVTALAASK